MNEINIISCDGGGMRGIITLEFLIKMEEYYKKKITEIFDVFVGTSINSIILSLMVYKDYSPTFIKSYFCDYNYFNNLFDNHYDIWTRKHYNFISKFPIIKTGIDLIDKIRFKPKYYNKYEAVKDIFETIKFSDTSKKVIFPIYNCVNSSPYLFKSYDNSDFLLCDVVYSAISIPGTFRPLKVFSLPESFVGIDGALFRNNPSDVAFSEALSIYGTNTKFNILSVGTGNRKYDYNDALLKWGNLQWLFNGNLFERIVDSNSCISCDFTQKICGLYGHNFHRANIDVPVGEKNDLYNFDKSSIEHMMDLGQQMWNNNCQSVTSIFPT